MENDKLKEFKAQNSVWLVGSDKALARKESWFAMTNDVKEAKRLAREHDLPQIKRVYVTPKEST